MRVFTLHIGLHKTASSFLQQYTFPSCKETHYIDRNEFRKRNSDGPFKSWLLNRDFEMGFSRSPEFWNVYGSALIKNAIPKDVLDSNINVLGSSEGITNARVFVRNDDPFFTPFTHMNDPSMLTTHLNNFKAQISEFGFDSLKVILAIRKQDTWLASNYAEFSHLIRFASQSDFEKQVDHLIDPKMRYYWEGVWLNFQYIRDCIVNSVGKDNLAILPQEFLAKSPELYLEKLSRFIDDKGILQSPKTIYEKNKNRTDINKWKLKPRNYYIRPLSLFNKYTNRIVKFKTPRTNYIEITNQLSNKILAPFISSNKILDKYENLNLKEYGYY